MADVTFGVKVTEEMKSELSEIMKNTDLSGKEFMGLLLSAYKLEKNKKEDNILGSDINELQKLLNRIQGLYLNIGERATFYIEEQLREKDLVNDQKEEANKELIESLSERDKEISGFKEKVEVFENLSKEAKKKEEQLKKIVEEQKNVFESQSKQLKNNQLLYEKYEEEINNLKKTIENYKRIDLEIQERNDENTKLQKRNDELASEVWFLKREIEKYEQKEVQSKNQFELQLKNALLEQKISFNEQIDTLKDEQFKIQQDYTEMMQRFLEKKVVKTQVD